MIHDYKSIHELLNAPEGERYEFKKAENRFDFTEALRYCCAMANCGGGKLVLGISDKRPREVTGTAAFEQPERTRNSLIEKLHVRVDFQLYESVGKRILVFEVAGRPVGLPVQVDGIAWWRIGDSLVPMPQEILRDIYFESGHDFSGDICSGATMQDLDINAIEIFRSKWIERRGGEHIKNLSAEQLLRDCEAISDKGVTYAALILFGTRSSLGQFLPQSEIVFEYRSSEAPGPAQQREEFRVGFFACYDRIWELINLRNDEQHYQDGLFVLGIPTFNERVVREALLNAVSHRNYQLGGSVFVRQYRDKLAVESPGGFPTGVTPDNILDRQSPRNRRIAEILARCGLVERSGQGMNLIYKLCIREAKKLPDFTGTDAYFVRITLNGLIVDEKMLLFIKNIGGERLDLLTADDFLIIDSLFYGRELSNNLRSRIDLLIDMGIVEFDKRGKCVLVYSLHEEAVRPEIKSDTVHTRQAGSEHETNKELVLKYMRQNDANGIALKDLQQILPNYSRKRILLILNKLRNESMVKLEGRKWHIT